MNDESMLPEPFLGRMVIETIKEDSEDYLKKQMKKDMQVSSEFLNKLELVTMQEEIDPETGRKKFVHAKRRVPISKGKIIKMAPDCFGEAFVNKYGDGFYTPKIGDVILFIPNESFKIDAEDKYHLVCDCDVIGYHKVNTKEVVTNE